MAIATMLLLTACATTPRPADGGGCDAAKIAPWLGRSVDAGAIEGARRAAGAKTVRVIRPGSIVTMDYREDRLNVEVDGAGRVTKVRCG